jgi:hypothetical protein
MTAGKYGPRFPAAVIRSTYPAATVEAFTRSGQNVITGTTHYWLALHAFYLQMWGIWKTQQVYNRVINWQTQNVVASVRLPHQLNLLMFHCDHPTTSEINPELFAGLRYATHGMKFIMFSSGALVLTGAKSETHLRQAWEEERHKIAKYEVGKEWRQLTQEEADMFRITPKSSKRRKLT